jgi:sugar phosphate isomerase/epimerase
MDINVGLQLYSLREKCAENLENVYKALSGAGYDGVELYTFYGMEAIRMKQLLDKYGLKPMGTHAGYDMLKNDLDGLIRYAEALGMEYVGLSYFKSDKKDDWLRMCEVMEKSGEKIRRNGFDFLYHNHNHELEPLSSGERPLDIILENTSAENVSLELDCYWVKYAGIEPKTFLKNNLSRIKTIHLKDMGKDRKMTEVGTGIIDCKGIYNICRDAGFKWVVIEQDDIYMEPFESVKISVENVRKF